ncbi:flagellar M-ring protein FliF [Pacificimonas aurantium]|nr:flagellar M-ring protein FliF [Pacificimonas aurantium]
MGGVAVLLLAGMTFVAVRGSSPQMGFLFTDLDPGAAQSISEQLQAQNIPFRLSADGTSIMAPQDRLADLRMQMAGERLGGKIGYDILDEEEPFGISASRARLNETRALEGELIRSIQSLEAVTRARVHIVMPERAMFAAEGRKATAAVTVATRGRLPSETVQSIRYLVASAVPELTVESVSVVDNTGALLARAGAPGEIGAAEADERQLALEERLRTEVEALLEPIVGLGKVRAKVSARINRRVMREEANIFDPDGQVIARQVSVESSDQDTENAGADEAATVADQLPENFDAAGAGGPTRAAARTESSEDTTYQNSQTRRIVTEGPGTVERLSVAVMIDGGEEGLAAEDIQRLTRLVETAVGVDAERGDTVVVESMPFTDTAFEPLGEPGMFSFVTTDMIVDLLKLVLIGAAGLIALRMMKPREALAAAGAEVAALPGSDPIDLVNENGAQGAEGSAAALEGPEETAAAQNQLSKEISRRQLAGSVAEDAVMKVGDAISESPSEAAVVIRNWLNS